MTFKRPYWVLLFISITALVLGFAAWMLVTPDLKGEPDLRWWIFGGGEFLMLVGAVALVSSLLWMIIAAVFSKDHPST